MADYYQYIFPSHKKIEFLNTEFKGFSDLLDVGCSDGRVAKGLSDKGFNIEAFDLNKEMVRVARDISKNEKDFKVSLIDMTRVDKHFEDNSFDGIYCIGNTLVHLKDYNLIENTIKKLKTLLKEDGKLVIQIINYDYIYDKNIKELPLIENEKLKFERYYELEKENVIFKTKLKIKETDEKFKGSVDLFPIRKDELEKALKSAGFNKFKYYGGFGRKKFSSKARPLIVVASI